MVSHVGTAGRSSELATLEIEQLRVGHRIVLVLSGELDLATASSLGDAVEAVVESGAVDVWVDLSAVEFMDSSGLKALLSARGALARGHRRLAVICPAGPVRRVLEISGVAPALAIHPSRAAAHAAG